MTRVILLVLLLIGCEQPHTSGEPVANAYRQDREHCAQYPTSVFCEAP